MATSDRLSARNLLLGAAFFGTIVGTGSTPAGRGALSGILYALSGTAPRSRAPQPGDHWGGCNDARAAGTAPIYSGEPGYRSEMDGDGDGIACEPYRGQ